MTLKQKWATLVALVVACLLPTGVANAAPVLDGGGDASLTIGASCTGTAKTPIRYTGTYYLTGYAFTDCNKSSEQIVSVELQWRDAGSSVWTTYGTPVTVYEPGDDAVTTYKRITCASTYTPPGRYWRTKERYKWVRYGSWTGYHTAVSGSTWRHCR